jgi:hypothetical protein
LQVVQPVHNWTRKSARCLPLRRSENVGVRREPFPAGTTRHSAEEGVMMQVFSFYSAETFHFFNWLLHGGAVNPDDIMAEAIRRTRECEDFDPNEHDLSASVAEDLQNILDELLSKQFEDFIEQFDGWDFFLLPDWTGFGGFIDHPESLQTKEESFLLPLLAEQYDRIDTQIVAEALLVRAGMKKAGLWTFEVVGPKSN